jgi:NTE family protein
VSIDRGLAARQLHQDALLTQHLRDFLGELEPAAMNLLREQLQWVEVAGGQTLMEQGEAGDSMYLMVSGRLRAYVRDDDGSQHMVREMGRGQIVGEMSLYTDEPRSATVVAIRDSVLVRLHKSHFNQLLASSSQLSLALTRQIIRRLQTQHRRNPLALPVAMGLLPISEGVDVVDFGRRLAAELGRIGRVCVLDAAAVDAALGVPGACNSQLTGAEDAALGRRIALLLDEIEAGHEFVLLLADPSPTPWTQRCSRHCDELLLLADATRPPALHPTEQQCLMVRTPRAEAAEILVLLQPTDLPCPQGTRAWLDRRAVSGHLHIRPELERDMARLARIQSRTAVGLVLAGGGARGLAHLGIYRALREHGIEIDCVGGTSMGAVMATLVASDRPPEVGIDIARKAFGLNPTGDFNLLPLLSLIKGQRLRTVIGRALGELLGAGADADIEDLWKSYFCIATNYSQAREERLQRGNLMRALLASIAIPGALPPVIRDGDLLCDGGTFNNFPADVMLGMRGVGTVIGVDLNGRKLKRLDYDDIPGRWTLLLDRLRPRRRRRYRLPSMAAYLMNVTILYSISRQRQARELTDLYFNPPLERVGMLDWRKFDLIVQQGHDHAVEVLRERGGSLRRGAPRS